MVGNSLVKRTDGQIAVARLINRIVNFTLSRSDFIRSRGTSVDQGNRDLDRECGYIEGNPTILQYQQMYDQEGVATRIVSVLPEESFSVYPDVYEVEDATVSPFEDDLRQLEEEFDLWYYAQRLDEIAGIGNCGIMLIGIDDGRDLSDPVETIDSFGKRNRKFGRKKRDLTYLRPFSQNSFIVTEVEEDDRNPRFMQPTYYTIHLTNPNVINPSPSDAEQFGVDQEEEFIDKLVHWTRVLHYADNCKENEVFGVPRLQNQHRRVFDVRKILGGSGEMFYKGGFPGLSFETYPEFTGDADVDLDSIKDEIENYSTGLQRYMRLVGMQAKSLAPQVADPASHLYQQYLSICSTIGVPIKVFMGSEAGQRAGESDTVMWNRRINRRQNRNLAPRLVRPFIRRLVDMGVVRPTKNNRFFVNWRDLNALSDKDKADVALKRAQSILQYVTSGSSKLIAPREFFVLVLQMSGDEADAVIKAAGGEQKILAQMDKMMTAMAGNTPNTSAKNPTKKTGAGGRRNALGRSAKNKTRSRNGGN